MRAQALHDPAEASRRPRGGLDVGALLACATVVTSVWWGVWIARSGGVDAAPSAPRSPAEARQEEILRAAVDRPGDPELTRRFQQINIAHFGGSLPATPVMWEPRLDEVGALASRTFTLEGMFGRVGSRTVILLHPNLRNDEAALKRTLSHEMVHAALHAAGDSITDHGPAFQAILKRLADGGAFAGIVASQAEIENLRAWLDAESARLADEQRALEQASQELDRERMDLEEALRRVQASGTGPSAGYPEPVEIASWRASDDRALLANQRADRYRAAVEVFNREVERYNLMVSYPDGLDEQRLRQKIRKG